MQALRDAFTLLLVILIIATVRVSPEPKFELSPAQASEASRANSGVSGAGAEAEELSSQDPAVVEAAGRDSKAPCPQTLAVQAAPRKTPGSPLLPCDV